SFANLMLSLGPALVAAAIGLVVSSLPPEGGNYRESRQRDSREFDSKETGQKGSPAVSAFRRSLPALLLAVISLLVMHFVRLDVDTSCVGFRARQMFLVAAPVLSAGGLTATDGGPRL